MGAGAGAGRMRRHGISIPTTMPTAMAIAPTTTVKRVSVAGVTAATRPVVGPVVAVSVSAFVQLTFQIAVLRSSVKTAPGAEVISCGTVNEKVMVKMDAISLSEITCCDPGDGDAIGWGAVLNV